MKRIIVSVLMLVYMDFNVHGQSNLNFNNKRIGVMQKQDKALIQELLQTYKQSLNTSDANLSVSLYADDGVFMPSETPSAIGTERILQSYKFIFTQIQLDIEFYIDEIVVEGDFAYAVTSSKGTTLIHATGDKIPEANRELFVFERVKGQWKIARYMFNKTAPKEK